MSDANLYRAQWDRYATTWKGNSQPGEEAWPGDEWGNEERWSRTFKTMFLDYGASEWRNCVEIGPGSGKYTSLLLRNSGSHIIAFDISPAYLEVLKKRLAQDIENQRLEPALIKAEKPSELLEHLEERDLVRKLDAFYSIDAMVHVDLQYLVTYFVTASLTLKENGLLIMTLANVVSRNGFQHLIDGIKKYYAVQGKPTAKFEYLSPDIVTLVLGEMGFQVEYTSPKGTNLESSPVLFVVARLVDLERAETFRAALL